MFPAMKISTLGTITHVLAGKRIEFLLEAVRIHLRQLRRLQRRVQTPL
jgi:hypothetical protein